ncbi:serine protease 40 [Sus scrofa]|uniref:tryptase n=3 Tax=Sus scrofa TaxID=9823 RepID=A0A8D1JED9_PIG|nr:serine protease 40 [Sus scrofa]
MSLQQTEIPGRRDPMCSLLPPSAWALPVLTAFYAPGLGAPDTHGMRLLPGEHTRLSRPGVWPAQEGGFPAAPGAHTRRLAAQSGPRCRICPMEIAGPGGSGAGWWGACTLAVVVLCLLSLPLGTEVAGTTTQRSTQPSEEIQPQADTQAECGIPAVTGKIFGGRDAPQKRWPWQASVLYRGMHICGATIVSAYWVISAAHCFQKSHHPDDYQILLGYYRLKSPTQHSLQMSVYRVFVHNDFNKRYFMGSDITLLQLYGPVNFTEYIRPACLPGRNPQVSSSASCWITGWGMVTETTMLGDPYTLQEAQLGIMDSQICTMFFQGPQPGNNTYSVQDDMLCAGDLMTGKSICRGDSGGPFVCNLNNVWFLIGLSSWSLPCQQPVSPSVFTRVSYFSEWITQKQNSSPNPDPSSVPHPPSVPPGVPIFPSLGNIHKPRSVLTLVISQVLVLLLISLWTLQL